MKGLSVIIPAGVTAFLTAVAVFCAIWLTGLVPEGEWARLLKAGIVIFIIGSTLLIIAWSAYFTYIVRQSLQRLNEEAK
jgi:regulator of protease activity HflC (stomatin/prohibitin superfamily)